jgi:hypothetical protein
MSLFPDAAFETVPDPLGRAQVRQACTRAASGPEAARQAFLVVMAWGFGTIGYGPWRTSRMLDPAVNPTATERLSEVAVELKADGSLAAYRRLARQSRLKWLGPAFGTKFLYFCPQAKNGRRALILDRLVAGWLDRHAGVTLNPAWWTVSTYDRYLDVMHEWGDRLGLPPGTIEERIFVAQASAGAGQWAAG